MNNAFYNVAVSSKDPTPMTFGGGADVPVIMGKENSNPKQGALNVGLQAQNAYMTSLYNPDTYAEARIKILGDPDFLMQPSPSSINAFYNQYYGTDGFTINANGGQVFIEINFKEPKDYHNSTGLLSINQSIYFWNFPESIQKELNEQGGGIRYMVTSVVSNFSKGKFDQELFCNMSSFPGAENAVEAGAGRANQTAAISARTGVNLSTDAGAAARATFDANDSRLVNGPAATANGSASVPSSTDYSDPMGTGDSAAIISVVGKSQENTTVTVPTKSGSVQDDDSGVNYNYF